MLYNVLLFLKEENQDFKIAEPFSGFQEYVKVSM